MDYWKKYSDYDNQQLANLTYKNYDCGPHKVAGHKLYIKSVIKQPDGVKAYVVVPKSEAHLSPSHVHHVAVIYRGSNSPADLSGNGPADWTNDLIGAGNQLVGIKSQPEGFHDAASILNKEMAHYNHAKFVVTGHSYGGSSAYVASCRAKRKYLKRVENVRCYESPNMMNTLTKTELENAHILSDRTYTYVDTKDVVGMGYALYDHTGHLMEIVSPNKYKGPKGEHMWGGYFFHHGNLKYCKEVSRLPLFSGSGVAEDVFLLIESMQVGGSPSEINKSAAEVTISMEVAVEGATVLVKGLEESLPSQYKNAKSSAQAAAPDLSESEITGAFHDVGYTYHRYVTEPCRKLKRRIEELNNVAELVAGYTQGLSGAADNINTTDQSNANRISTISSVTQLFNVGGTK